jgi:hypothetical protein
MKKIVSNVSFGGKVVKHFFYDTNTL